MDSLRIFAKTILMHCKYANKLSYFNRDNYLNAGFSQYQISKIVEPYHLRAHLYG